MRKIGYKIRIGLASFTFTQDIFEVL